MRTENEVGNGIWDYTCLTIEECDEWESIVADYHNGEDKETHYARVADFKKRLDEKHKN